MRNVSSILKNLQERSAHFWNSDLSRGARNWVATRLKEADSRLRAARLARPGAFWAIVFGIIPVAIVIAILISGTAARVWATYHSNREDIAPLATFAAAIGAAVVAVTALMRHFAQTEADRQRRIVESFSKAVEQLGSDKLELRLGAIFALERLSKESPNDYWTIMEVLTAFVRERMRYANTNLMARLSERAYFLWLQAGKPEGYSEALWAEAVRIQQREEIPTDIAAILTVIKRRSQRDRGREKERGWRFDLHGTYLWGASLDKVDLQGADLSGARLEIAELQDAHLEGANLFGAHLEGANLRGAHLEGAELDEAHLEGAGLVNAHLDRATLGCAVLAGAFLRGAHLEGAVLSEANLEKANLAHAHLEGADLNGVNLEGAYLHDAHFEGAELSDAHLEGANLLGAKGLTDDQLFQAHGDGKTILPRGMARPNIWPTL
jgi:uncharacterized protein YjbI with pentapeptide repeats